jgi:hypothetical protein
MRIQILAALIGIGGLFVSGCSSSNGLVVKAPGVVTPTGIIRSQSDLQQYLSRTAATGSPLSALSSGARERFLSSITFGAKGISGFNFADLQSELTVSQIYDVLVLFGVQKDVAIIPNARVETAADKRVISSFQIIPGDGDGTHTDYSGYKCASRATCSVSVTDICTSNC